MLQHSKKKKKGGLTLDTKLTGFLTELTHHGVYSWLHWMPKWRGTYPQCRQGMRGERRRMDWVWQSFGASWWQEAENWICEESNEKKEQTTSIRTDGVLETFTHTPSNTPVIAWQGRVSAFFSSTWAPLNEQGKFTGNSTAFERWRFSSIGEYCKPQQIENKCTVWWVHCTVSHINQSIYIQDYCYYLPFKVWKWHWESRCNLQYIYYRNTNDYPQKVWVFYFESKFLL